MHFWYCDDIRNESDLEFDPSKKTITLLLVYNGTLITTFGILVLEGKKFDATSNTFISSTDNDIHHIR